MPDFFIDDADAESFQKLVNSRSAGDDSSHATSNAAGPAVDTADTELAKTFSAIQAMIGEDVVKSVKAVFVFDLKGWLLVGEFFVSNAYITFQ